MNDKIKNFAFNKLELIKTRPYMWAFWLLVSLFCMPFFIWFSYFIGDSGFVVVCTSLTVGEALNFYSTFLAFLGTLGLGFLALWQNVKANEINRKMLDSDLIKNFHTYLYPKYLLIFPCAPYEECKNVLYRGKGETEINIGYMRFQVNFISSNNHPIKSAKIMKFEIIDDTREPHPWFGTISHFSFSNKIGLVDVEAKSACTGNEGSETDANICVVSFETHCKHLLNQEQSDENESTFDFSRFENLQIRFNLSFTNIFNVETTAKYILYFKKDVDYNNDFTTRYVFFEENTRTSNITVESIQVTH